MSQLISIIISITLSAIISAIGYVFFGKAITTSSTKATTQYLLSINSQLETIMTTYKISEGKSAFLAAQEATPFPTDYFEDTINYLVDKKYMSNLPEKLNEDIEYYLDEFEYNYNTHILTNFVNIPEESCYQLNTIAGLAPEPQTNDIFSYGMERRFHCMLDTNIDAYVLQYIVE